MTSPNNQPAQNHNHTFKNPPSQQGTSPSAQSPSPAQPNPPSSPTTKLSNINQPLISPRTEFLLDWTLKVLSVAAAILFGIWAPISYKATEDANDDNNASQGTIFEALNSLKAQGSQNARAQSSIRTQMDAMATLRVWEFCDGKASSIAACAQVTSVVKIADVVTSLAGLTVRPGSTATSTSTPSSGAGPQDGNSRGAAKLPLAAVLGIVFGVLVLLGMGMGFFVWQHRMKRREAVEEAG
ncbi:hypothetical protein CC80DRAFT_495898 [Byssothecium circinans]|uniref:Mid2 domain-containing protein n=1 Tax=Byssothecium circinans TaxID=147558 RepID=A0A6A5TGM4_9PLEO|nr:hypothetical protein CC80DRAFT_495898 [Byssothecium circinans]